MQLFVGTPNLESRVIQFKQKMTGRDTAIERKALSSYRRFLESVWTQDAMFMNFLEGAQFASACAELVAARNELSESDMAALLAQQAAVMTVRGPAREEYLASMELTRL